jgi:predicted RecA/RadA family phage recombinase
LKNFIQTGDNLSFVASAIVAPAHSTGDTYTNLVGPGEGITTPINLVETGDPVVIGRICGVANNDALTVNDTIVVSTRGVYALAVKANYGAGIHDGETVYIDPVAATLSDNSAGIPFGCVVSSNTPVGSEVIPVGSTLTVNVKLFGQTPGATGFGS